MSLLPDVLRHAQDERIVVAEYYNADMVKIREEVYFNVCPVVQVDELLRDGWLNQPMVLDRTYWSERYYYFSEKTKALLKSEATRVS